MEAANLGKWTNIPGPLIAEDERTPSLPPTPKLSARKWLQWLAPAVAQSLASLLSSTPTRILSLSTSHACHSHMLITGIAPCIYDLAVVITET